MNDAFEQLKKYIGKNVNYIVSEEAELLDGVSYEICDVENEDMIAACSFDSDKKLVSYYLLEETPGGSLTSKDMRPIAESFIKQFYPHGLETYQLQSIIDLDDSYMVTYGIQDEKYGIDLPGTGFTLTISTSGEIVQFSYDHESVRVEYPEKMITNEEAKETYASLIRFEKIIQCTDTEMYVNGDNTYKTVYSVREAAVDIPASGQDPDVIEEGNTYKELNYQEPPATTFYEMVGITEEYILLGEDESEGTIIEKWMHYSLPFPETIDYTEFYSEQVITIHYDADSKIPVAVYNGEANTEDTEQLDNGQLNQRALDFLFLLFPKANECFLQEIEAYIEEYDDFEHEYEEELEEFDDEEYDEEVIEEEDSFAFYFQYRVNNIPVESCVTCIQVGKYTGNIISASIEPLNVQELMHVDTESTLSFEEAKDMYMRKLTMELTMAQEFNEEGESYFIPSYLPSFPETVGHVHMIDAKTGKAYFVDIGDSEFN